MPSNLTRWLAVAALCAVLSLPVAAAARPTTPGRPPQPLATAAEPHPEIQAALRSLERAKRHLERAAHDFGGHRVDAIKAIDAAREQLTLALQFDK
jgi:hypothetical protein